MPMSSKIMPNSPEDPSSPNRSVVALAYDGLCTFEFGIAAEVFGLARPEMGEDWYRFSTAAVDPGRMHARGGIAVTADCGLEALDNAGTIVVPGWSAIDAAVPQPLIERLVAAHARGARLVSICSGATVLAATGLLDGKTVATHWRYAEALARRFPQVNVDASILYIGDGQIFTSAGSSAGIDLLLHLVRCDFGAEKANAVARRLVMPAHREGGQAQYIERPVVPERGRLAPLLDAMRENLAGDHSIGRLAQAAAMSERTFLRRFREATGTTPGEWLINTRIDAARELLEQTCASIDEISAAAGFGSVEALRHHFRRRFGISPATYRRSYLPGGPPMRADA